MPDDPVVLSYERWKKRITAVAILCGLALVLLVVLLLEAEMVTRAWEFMRSSKSESTSDL